jgi:hypothetical protein
MKRLLLPLLAALAFPTAVNAGLDAPNNADNRAYAVSVIYLQDCFAEKGWIPREEKFFRAARIMTKKGLNPMIFAQDDRVYRAAQILTEICVRKLERNAESFDELRNSYEFRSAFDEVEEIIK